MNTLAHMEKGGAGVIQSVQGQPELRFRLQEMGFTPGAEVRLVAKAAFGGPMAFALRGTTIALRRSDADCVLL
jgi:Fe2+ transport system protein FeoA